MLRVHRNGEMQGRSLSGNCQEMKEGKGTMPGGGWSGLTGRGGEGGGGVGEGVVVE